jgi:hypothetical protein
MEQSGKKYGIKLGTPQSNDPPNEGGDGGNGGDNGDNGQNTEPETLSYSFTKMEMERYYFTVSSNTSWILQRQETINNWTTIGQGSGNGYLTAEKNNNFEFHQYRLVTLSGNISVTIVPTYSTLWVSYSASG